MQKYCSNLKGITRKFMKKEKLYRQYCTGCGLCSCEKNTTFEKSKNGFLFPKENDELNDFCPKVCPCYNDLSRWSNTNNIWGSYKEVYCAFSTDENIRKSASSGGCLTAISIWLLKNKKIDGVIQTKVDECDPMKTVTVVSVNKEDVLKCVGSRYAESSLLLNINRIIESGKRYAFIGKPCDVSTLSRYMILNPKLKDFILYKFSFFCAGTPSCQANKDLIEYMKLDSSLMKLRYRGDGWPGYTKATDANGAEYTMTYQDAWMNILGRDIRLMCKFCFDSIGEYADISCGDYWYLDANKNPDFSEHDGRNCLFSWTNLGSELIKELISDKALHVEKIDINELKWSQPNHYNRRSTMFTKLIVMKLFHRNIPKYDLKVLFKFTFYSSLKSHLRTAKGTWSRIKGGSL